MSATIASRNHTRIITLIIALLVSFAATKTGAVEISRPYEGLQIGQCDTDTVTAVRHRLVLQNNDTVAYLSSASRKICTQLCAALSPVYRRVSRCFGPVPTHTGVRFWTCAAAVCRRVRGFHARKASMATKERHMHFGTSILPPP
jgi:hypothetical protein